MKTGDRVRVWKYGAWYPGLVVKVGPVRVTVRFTTKGGKTKEQTFNKFDRAQVTS